MFLEKLINLRLLKKEGYGMIAVKSRSIDVTKSPKEVYKEAIKKLEKDFEIIDWKTLDPFEEAHCFIVAKFKNKEFIKT
jgi:fibrillarin-like pre-rRNA processing protein